MPLLEESAVRRVLGDEHANVVRGEVVVELVLADDLDVANRDVPADLLPQSLEPCSLPAAHELLLGQLHQVLEHLGVRGVERIEALLDGIPHCGGCGGVKSVRRVLPDYYFAQDVFRFPAMHTLEHFLLFCCRQEVSRPQEGETSSQPA